MKNFDLTFEGPKNQWSSKPAGFVTWFSAGVDTGFGDGRLQMFSMHLWLFGFQIFELGVYRIN